MTWGNWFLFFGICGGFAFLIYAVAQETPKRKVKPRPQLTLIVNKRFPEGA